jgi:cell division GTPase FtsZ
MDRRQFLKLVGVSGAATGGAAYGQVIAERDIPLRKRSDIALNSEFDGEYILIACGGAGIEMTKSIDKVTYGISRIVAIDTDKIALRHAHHCDAVYWVRRKDGREVTSGDEAWHAAEGSKDKIAQLIGVPHLAIVVTGLGGAAGFGLPYMAARCAKQAGAMSVAFATLPLAYEGDEVPALASAGQSVLNQEVDNLLTYDHRLVDRFLPAFSGYASVYDYAVQGLRQYLWNTVGCHTRQGIVGIDFEDVRTVLRHKPDDEGLEGLYSWPTSRLGWASASGPDRATQAAAMALQNPLLEVDHIGQLHGASVSIRTTRSTLKMKEVNEVMNVVKARCDPDTHIIFSDDADDTLADRLQVSIILVPKGDDLG